MRGQTVRRNHQASITGQARQLFFFIELRGEIPTHRNVQARQSPSVRRSSQFKLPNAAVPGRRMGHAMSLSDSFNTRCAGGYEHRHGPCRQELASVNKLLRVVGLALVMAMTTACGGGGGGGGGKSSTPTSGNPSTPAGSSSNWDSLKWDQDNWS